MIISDKMIVSVSYELFVQAENEKPELMEQATAERPLNFCFGIGMMLEKFEKELSGKKTGDKFDFVIPCEEAYGEYSDEHVVELPKNIFEVEGKFDNELVFVGNIIPLMDAQGNRFNAEVLSVDETTVTVDLNHPLAGENLHFVGEVLDVHEASDEELGKYLGNGCGGGCSSCGGSCETSSCDCESSGCSCN